MSRASCRVCVQCLAFMLILLSCGAFAALSIKAHTLLVQQLGDSTGL